MQGLPVVTGPDWGGVRYFCTTRQGGVGQKPHDTLNLGLHAGDTPACVLENRQRVRAAVPAEPFWLRQVHGSHVIDADDSSLVAEPEADASITTQPGRVLAIMVADCLPVIISDIDGQVLGVAHAGWRGLAADVLENTLSAMRSKRPHSRGWRAWIGPGIGPETFEVGADVFKAFTVDDLDARQCFTAHPHTPDKWLADLSSLAQRRLRKAGVEHVYPSGLCTFTDNARFFSYRRDGVTGRMALLAWLDPQQTPIHAASDQTKIVS